MSRTLSFTPSRRVRRLDLFQGHRQIKKKWILKSSIFSLFLNMNGRTHQRHFRQRLFWFPLMAGTSRSSGAWRMRRTSFCLTAEFGRAAAKAPNLEASPLVGCFCLFCFCVCVYVLMIWSLLVTTVIPRGEESHWSLNCFVCVGVGVDRRDLLFLSFCVTVSYDRNYYSTVCTGVGRTK